MKKTTALLLLFAMLLTTTHTLSVYASPTEGEGENVTAPVDPIEPVDPPSTEPPSTTPSIPEPPITNVPVTIPPSTLPPVTVPPTTQPPVTVPPITEPPVTQPPYTEPEPVPSEEELLFRALADVIDHGLPALQFNVPEKLTDELIRTVCKRALEFTPRFFYLGGINVTIDALTEPDEAGNIYAYTITPEYRFAPGEELDAAKAYVDEKTSQIIAQIPENASDLEKLLFLHDYLCTHFAYDGTHTIGDLYHLLQSGHGVCQAYVYLYAHLLDQLSIPNSFAISEEMNHIWNIVQLHGEWYHIDLTWDDPTVDQIGRALHKNFLRSDTGIAETGHRNWTAPYLCSSDLFEKSFLTDLTGAVLFTSHGAYGISQSNRELLELNFSDLTTTPAVDLSQLRWGVWDKPESLWKEQYINLYSDGTLIYFNGPDSIWSYDPQIQDLELLHAFAPHEGYLYSLSGDGHTLTCTVSTAPGVSQGTVQFTTPHIYRLEEGVFFATHSCVVCGHSEEFLSPVDGDFITACLSTRVSAEMLHDLRLTLLVDEWILEEFPPLTVQLTLHSADGDRSVTTTISDREHGLFLVYERIHAGGREYGLADGYEMLGLIIRNLDNGRYDNISVTVMAEEDLLYSSTLSADILFPTPDEPPVTDEPPITGEPPVTNAPPLTGEIPSDAEPLPEAPPIDSSGSTE